MLYHESPSAETRVACATVAGVLAQIQPSSWAGWLLYILEELDGRAPEEEYRAALAALQEAIAARLEQGRW